MKNSRLLLCSALAAGSLVLVCALVLGSRNQDSSRPSTTGVSVDRAGTPAAASTDMTRMRTQVAVLQAQVAGLRDQVAAGPAPTADQAAAEVVVSDADRRAEGDRRQAAYIAGIEAAFAREVVDPGWSPAISKRVWAAIDGIDVMRGATRGVECRATSCRVEVQDDGSGALSKGLPLFAQQFADALPRMAGQVVRDESGPTGMVLYLMGPDQAPGPTQTASKN
ncbi:MAG TPA: hypothetical protein VK698_38200 [Kofleriaceae bacterium]|nr:hypothetical protein [Kofleriaceae bacterium]